MGGHNIKENGSGKYNPTAYNAIRNVSMDEQAEERIVVKNKRTGRIWR